MSAIETGEVDARFERSLAAAADAFDVDDLAGAAQALDDADGVLSVLKVDMERTETLAAESNTLSVQACGALVEQASFFDAVNAEFARQAELDRIAAEQRAQQQQSSSRSSGTNSGSNSGAGSSSGSSQNSGGSGGGSSDGGSSSSNNSDSSSGINCRVEQVVTGNADGSCSG